MRKYRKLFIVAGILLSLVLFSPATVRAEDPTPPPDATNTDILNAINSLNETISSSNQEVINSNTNLQNELQSLNSKLDTLNQNQSTTNTYVTDTTQPDPDVPATGTAYEQISGFIQPVGPLSTMLADTTSFLNGVVNLSCSPINIPLPFTGGSLNLPCMSQKYPSGIGLLAVVINGSIAYGAYKKLARAVREARDPDHKDTEFLHI